MCGWSRSFVVWLFGFFENCQLGGSRIHARPWPVLALLPPNLKFSKLKGCQNGNHLGSYKFIFWGSSWTPSWKVFFWLWGAGGHFLEPQQASQNPSKMRPPGLSFLNKNPYYKGLQRPPKTCFKRPHFGGGSGRLVGASKKCPPAPQGPQDPPQNESNLDPKK